MKKNFILFAAALAAICFPAVSFAQTWIWFPGEVDNWIGNQMNNSVTWRGTRNTTQWKISGHEPLMIFTKNVDLSAPEQIEVFADCDYYSISIGRTSMDGKGNGPTILTVPAGKSIIKIKAVCYANPPAIFVKGATIMSNSSWMASPVEQMRATRNMRHPALTSPYSLPAGSGGMDDHTVKPSSFRLETRQQAFASTEKVAGGTLYDFGRETFGFVMFKNLTGRGKMTIQFGETREEALDGENCETLQTIDVPSDATEYLSHAFAMRYVFIPDFDGQYDRLDLLYEYNPGTTNNRSSFVCSDPLLNKIWDTSIYTLELTDREIFVDGIKRDRWAWSGDAIESYLMNYYSFFDTQTVRRTIWTLRGNDPVVTHINNIMDYTLYWFQSIYDYYLYTGDKLFLEQIYPRMDTMMDFILDRRDADGLLTGLQGDWVYIDWVAKPVDVSGEVSAEQMLFCKALETMSECASVLGIESEHESYAALAEGVRSKLGRFWDNNSGGYIFNIPSMRSEAHQEYAGSQQSVVTDKITRHANMFAVKFGYATPEQDRSILDNVLLNPSVTALSTPYMRFYELEALCSLGLQDKVLSEIKNYWGGMLDLGATSFWEQFSPAETAGQHTMMYGRKYGRSFCHAWGASPIYLLGKYFVGVSPTSPGYATFDVRPVLGSMEWFDAAVPTPGGKVKVHADKKKITVSSDEGKGRLYFSSRKAPKVSGGALSKTGDNAYCLEFSGDGTTYTINIFR